jgi:hypothetical protein
MNRLRIATAMRAGPFPTVVSVVLLGATAATHAPAGDSGALSTYRCSRSRPQLDELRARQTSDRSPGRHLAGAHQFGGGAAGACDRCNKPSLAADRRSHRYAHGSRIVHASDDHADITTSDRDRRDAVGSRPRHATRSQ